MRRFLLVFFTACARTGGAAAAWGSGSAGRWLLRSRSALDDRDLNGGRSGWRGRGGGRDGLKGSHDGGA